jgi:hypothetical protein
MILKMLKTKERQKKTNCLKYLSCKRQTRSLKKAERSAKENGSTMER